MPSQALLHSRRFVLNLRTVFLIVVWCLTAAASVPAQTPAAMPSRDATPDATREDRELNEARRRNEDAQAEYYRTQTEKLNQPVPTKSFWRALSDNAAILGALTAALVALFTLIVNQRTALRARKDTEFYEALKRFGDKDSPTVRASAAAILKEMSDTSFFAWRWRKNAPWWRPDKKMTGYPYFETVLDLLITGLLIEEHSVVVHSVVAALKRIMPRNFQRSADQLRDANLKLQEDMAKCLMEFFVAKGIDVDEAKDEEWNEATSLTGCPQKDLRAILFNFGGMWFWGALFIAEETYKLVEEAEKRPYMRELQSRLASVGRRLRLNVALCSTLLHARTEQAVESLNFSNTYLGPANLLEANLRSIDFTAALLPGTDFSGANLEGACFEDAFMFGARFNRTDLTDANLFSNEITSTNYFYESNWWQADFNRRGWPIDTGLNKSLLDKLISHWGELSSDQLKKAHSSVKAYLAQRNQSRKNDATKQETGSA